MNLAFTPWRRISLAKGPAWASMPPYKTKSGCLVLMAVAIEPNSVEVAVVYSVESIFAPNFSASLAKSVAKPSPYAPLSCAMTKVFMPSLSTANLAMPLACCESLAMTR